MKKFFATLLMFFVIFSAGCGDNKSDENKKIPEQKVETQKVEKTPEQIQAEKEEAERQAKIQAEKIAAEKAEREKNYLANNYNEIYQWCYWMFYKIGYSDDVLQYHISNGDAESMRDLKFVMNKFQNDIQQNQYSIDTNIPDNIRNVMLSARNNLQKSFELREKAALSNPSENIQQSNQLENEVVQQLIQIQQMLPEGVKYWSYQGIYDPNDELDIPSEYKNNFKVQDNTNTKTENGNGKRIYRQV